MIDRTGASLSGRPKSAAMIAHFPARQRIDGRRSADVAVTPVHRRKRRVNGSFPGPCPPSGLFPMERDRLPRDSGAEFDAYLLPAP